MIVPVKNMQGEAAGELEVRDDVFAIEPNESVMHQAAKRQLANVRQGTADVKTRAEVEGGTHKMFRQKGTGHARQGDSRAPHWRKGGIVGGPTPRSYEQKMPKKMRRLALKSALSVKAQAGQLLVLDELKFDAPKTKPMIELLDRLHVTSAALLLLSGDEPNVAKSCRNLADVKMLNARYLNVIDLLNHETVIAPKSVIQLIEQTFAS